MILRQAVIVEGLKLETEELTDRISKLESDLDESTERNAALSGALEQRSTEMDSRLAEAKASAFKVSEENEELRKTVKEMETLIDEVQQQKNVNKRVTSNVVVYSGPGQLPRV